MFALTGQAVCCLPNEKRHHEGHRYRAEHKRNPLVVVEPWFPSLRLRKDGIVGRHEIGAFHPAIILRVLLPLIRKFLWNPALKWLANHVLLQGDDHGEESDQDWCDETIQPISPDIDGDVSISGEQFQLCGQFK